MFPFKITFYVLSNELLPDQILTVTNTKEQCKEFYHKYLCSKHMHVFKPWCEDRGLDVKDINSWHKYYNEKISSAESGTYKFAKMKLTKNELMSLLRALTNAPLMGCSFETEFDQTIRTL